jgi:hypothetical protein
MSAVSTAGSFSTDRCHDQALAHPSFSLLIDAAARSTLSPDRRATASATAARDLTEDDLRLAFLSAEGDPGASAGSVLLRALAQSSTPVVLTLASCFRQYPAHRKVNRVDMGTADKVCAPPRWRSRARRACGCSERDVSFILLELGGAFTAAIAVDGGRIVDGWEAPRAARHARGCRARRRGRLSWRLDLKDLLFAGGVRHHCGRVGGAG